MLSSSRQLLYPCALVTLLPVYVNGSMCMCMSTSLVPRLLTHVPVYVNRSISMCMSTSLVQLLLVYVNWSWSKEPPPPGGYLLCSLIKNREEEDPPWRTTPKIDQFWGWFFMGGPLPPGSWSGNIVNRKPPGGGRFFWSKCLHVYEYIPCATITYTCTCLCKRKYFQILAHTLMYEYIPCATIHHVRIYKCMHVRIYKCMYVRIYKCMYVRIHKCMHSYVSVWASIWKYYKGYTHIWEMWGMYSHFLKRDLCKFKRDLQ